MRQAVAQSKVLVKVVLFLVRILSMIAGRSAEQISKNIPKGNKAFLVKLSAQLSGLGMVCIQLQSWYAKEIDRQNTPKINRDRLMESIRKIGRICFKTNINKGKINSCLKFIQ